MIARTLQRLFVTFLFISCASFILRGQQSGLVAASDVKEQCDNPAACEDPKCPSRPHIIRCAAAHLDSNQNGKLERAELEAAIDSLAWYARGILKIIGSVEKIMSKCDADGDDAIGIDTDMPKTEETCLATCFKRKAFKSAFFPDCDL